MFVTSTVKTQNASGPGGIPYHMMPYDAIAERPGKRYTLPFNDQINYTLRWQSISTDLGMTARGTGSS